MEIKSFNVRYDKKKSSPPLKICVNICSLSFSKMADKLKEIKSILRVSKGAITETILAFLIQVN